VGPTSEKQFFPFTKQYYVWLRVNLTRSHTPKWPLTLIVCQYIYYRWVHEQKQYIEKTLIGNLWYVGESVGNKYTYGFTNGQSAPNFFYLFYFIGISIGKFNISPTRKLYVMPSVFLFVRLYIN
jgi:uncharacterized membrane protein